MLFRSERLPGILPSLNKEQTVEVTALHSVAGTLHPVHRRPPFIAPHHSITRAALLGGGSGQPRPGAISLAHHGVLFLDEVSEIPAGILDSLRTPLEHGRIKLSRARHEVIFPAQFQLVLAANPCRCGAEEAAACRCTARERAGYLANLSGPLRDRLDLGVRLPSSGAVLYTDGAESSAVIAERVAAARCRSRRRWESQGLPVLANSQVDSSYLRRHAPADDSAMALLGAYLASGDISQRGVDRALKVAWSICDLEGGAQPTLAQVARAVELRAGVGAEAVL